MKDIMGLMKQAKEMQSKMEGAQAQIADLIVEGQAGAGLIKLSMTGEGNLKSLSIDESLFNHEDKDVVEDLIIAAFQDAKARMDTARAETMQSAFGGLQLPPGMKMPF